MEWPPDALTAVARQILSKSKEIEMAEDVRNNVVKVMVDAQVSVIEITERFFLELKRVFYVTPTSYLELIGSFMSLLKQQRAVVAKAKWRYDVGLQKIADAKGQVSALQIELNDLEPILEKAAQETAAIMETCTTEKAKASEKQELVSEDQAKAEVQKANAAVIAADCENDLAA